MNTVKRIVLSLLFIVSSYISQSWCDLNDLPIIQESNDFIMKSINEMNEELFTPKTLQILCNIFFSAFEYARFDLESNFLKRSIITELDKLTKESACATCAFNKSLKMLDQYEKNKKLALQRWNHVSAFMNENEALTELFTLIATARLEFLNTVVKNNSDEISVLITSLLTATRTTTQKIHIVSNFLQAASEKALPIDYEESYAQLKEIDILSTITQQLNNEIDSLRSSLHAFEQYNDTFLTLCAILDMLYFNRLHEILLKKSEDTVYNTILFNENGLIPEDERVDLLPYAIN